MLTWLRIRKQVEDVHRIAVRPIALLASRSPELFPALWRKPYCCTITYFWCAVVAEQTCGLGQDPDAKLRTLREAFIRVVEDTGGTPHEAMKRVMPHEHAVQRRALGDLKRVVDLYNGQVNDRHMIYPDYREAVFEDGRPVSTGDKPGPEKEFAYEILLARYLAANGSETSAQMVGS